MSLSLNKVTICGNVGRDPEIRFTQSGEPIANFTLATSERWKTKQGEQKEETSWHRVEVFGKTAQFVRDYVKKGTCLYIEGAIRYEEWLDKDGNKKYGTKIKVAGFNSCVKFAGPKPEASAAPSDGPAEEFQATDEDVPF